MDTKDQAFKSKDLSNTVNNSDDESLILYPVSSNKSVECNAADQRQQ